MRIAPVFDNGTSMGHEISPNKFNVFNNEKYSSHGRHHIKWALSDAHSAGHLELLVKLVDMYPETRQIMLDCLKMINDEILTNILDELVSFNVPIKLSTERAAFMLKLLHFRYTRLLNELEK